MSGYKKREILEGTLPPPNKNNWWYNPITAELKRYRDGDWKNITEAPNPYPELSTQDDTLLFIYVKDSGSNWCQVTVDNEFTDYKKEFDGTKSIISKTNREGWTLSDIDTFFTEVVSYEVDESEGYQLSTMCIVLPPSIQENIQFNVESWSFFGEGTSNLIFVFGSSVKSFSGGCFGNALGYFNSVTTVCGAITPPKIESTTFIDQDRESPYGDIYVREGASADYKKDTNWVTFFEDYGATLNDLDNNYTLENIIDDLMQ